MVDRLDRFPSRFVKKLNCCRSCFVLPECTFIILDKQQWAAPGVKEEQCMVGDVNIFLTDPTDPSLAELEIMIAGGNYYFFFKYHELVLK